MVRFLSAPAIGARDIVSRAEIFMEYAPQARLEGLIQQLSADHPVTELWEVVVGRKPEPPFEKSHHDFRPLGFAIGKR